MTPTTDYTDDQWNVPERGICDCCGRPGLLLDDICETCNDAHVPVSRLVHVLGYTADMRPYAPPFDPSEDLPF